MIMMVIDQILQPLRPSTDVLVDLPLPIALVFIVPLMIGPATVVILSLPKHTVDNLQAQIDDMFDSARPLTWQRLRTWFKDD